MKRDTVVIIYLSLSLLVVQYLLMKSQQRTAYLEGRQSVFDSAASTDNCYAKDGDCMHNPNGEVTEK